VIFVVINYGKKEIDPKRIIQALFSTAALAFAIFLAVWIIDYFNTEVKMVALTNLVVFLNNNWPIIIGFVLLIQIWEYIYPFYKKWLKYAKPLIDAISLIFGLWLVVVFLNGLRMFNETTQVDFFLRFPHELFFTQLVVVVGLFIFIKYAQFFLYESKKFDDDE